MKAEMSNNPVAGLLVGAAVGAIAGLLWAPKLGKGNRRVVVVQAGGPRRKAVEYESTMRRMMRKKESGEAVEGITERQVGTPG